MNENSSHSSEQGQPQYTCTQLREANILKDAPPCCPYCHSQTHQQQERQHVMRHKQTPEGRQLILCCQVDSYLLPINTELDDELKIIEGHVGA